MKIFLLVVTLILSSTITVDGWSLKSLGEKFKKGAHHWPTRDDGPDNDVISTTESSFKLPASGEIDDATIDAAIEFIRPKWDSLSEHKKLKKPEELKSEYGLINDRLLKEVKGDDPMENLLTVISWIKDDNHHSSNKISQQSLIQLGSLVILSADSEKVVCDLETYEILYKNAMSIGTDLSFREKDPYDRLFAIMREAGLDHVQDCKAYHLKHFKTALEEFTNSKHFEEFIKFISMIIRTSTKRPSIRAISKDPRQVIKEKAEAIEDLRKIEVSEEIHSYLVSKTYEDPDGRYLSRDSPYGKFKVNAAKLNELFDKYALPNCINMVEMMRDHLEPGLYNNILGLDNNKRRNNSDDNLNYNLWTEYYRLCDRMVDEDQQVLKQNLLKVVKDKWNH